MDEFDEFIKKSRKIQKTKHHFRRLRDGDFRLIYYVDTENRKYYFVRKEKRRTAYNKKIYKSIDNKNYLKNLVSETS